MQVLRLAYTRGLDHVIRCFSTLIVNEYGF